MNIPQSLPEKRRFWKKHVKAWRKSGLPQSQYARQNGIHPRTLLDWGRKIPPGKSDPRQQVGSAKTIRKPEQSGIEFVPVPVQIVSAVENHPAPCGNLAINLGRRFQIVVPQDFSPSLLARVVQTLEGIQ